MWANNFVRTEAFHCQAVVAVAVADYAVAAEVVAVAAAAAGTDFAVGEVVAEIVAAAGVMLLSALLIKHINISMVPFKVSSIS